MKNSKQSYWPAVIRKDWPSITCLLLGISILIAFFNGWILVVGSHVVHTWMISSALLMASLVLWRIRAERSPVPNPDGTRSSLMRSCPSIFLVAILGAGCALGALEDIGTRSSILKSQGLDGCRAVARETHFLNAGRGEIYAVNQFGIGKLAGKWAPNDEYRPVEAGNYTLNWGAAGGELTISGAYVSRTRQQNIARQESLKPRIDRGELNFNDAFDLEPFDQQLISCH